MKIRVYQSAQGDCLLLQSSAKPVIRVLIDGGLAQSYRQHVAPDLAKLKAPLDLVHVSHIDDDHIGGVLQMMDDLVDWRVYDYQRKLKNPKAKKPDGPRPPGAKKIWHNAFHELLGDNAGAIEDMLAASTSILAASRSPAAALVRENQQELMQSKGQALKLARRVGPGQLGIAVNPEVKHRLMLLRKGTPSYAIGALKFHLLGPVKEDLDKLRDEWQTWIRDNKKQIADIKRRAKADEDRLGTDVGRLLEPLTMGADDFLRQQLEAAKKLGNRNLVTTPNLASMMFLVEEGQQRLLLTGDGHSNDVVKGLRARKLLDAHGKLHVDVIKVPHHGSEHNITPAFCRDITADHYVFCGNGAHTNPEIDVVKSLAQERFKARPARGFTFWFNADPADKQNKYAAQMVKVRAEVTKQIAATGGKLKAKFIKGSYFDI